MNMPGDRSKVVRSYHDLIVWQKSMALAEVVYSVTASYPRNEIYGLTSQMRRAAVSVPSNIAEGQARNGRGELLQFLSHARGSLAELETQMELSSRIGLLNPESKRPLQELISEVGRLLNGYRASLVTPKR